MAKLPSLGPVVTGRRIAARVIARVSFEGAYAAAALDAELSRATDLDPREKGLATEIAYGVLRTRPALLRRIERYAKRLPRDEVTLVHLLVAVYQITLLERVPAFAAVNAAVEAVRSERGPKLAGFVNAVLRRLAQSSERLDPVLAVRDSGPAWLIERLTATVGEDEALKLLGAHGVAPASVRLVSGRELPAWLEGASEGKVSPRARRVTELGDLRVRPGYREGSFVVQEEGAQVVAFLLGARAGERVLDACAGRGQKTSLLSELVGPTGSVWAADLHPKKLDALRLEAERLGLPSPECRSVDLGVGVADLPDDFDRVLVDAPCTGTGTLARRPEIKERIAPSDPARLADLQTSILERAASRLRPGGRLIYAVCSVLPEEAEGVVERAPSMLVPAPFDAPELEGRLSLDRSSLRLLPGAHGTDGYFVASFVRR